MSGIVRVLFVEDVPTDAELAEREIRQVLPSSSFRCIDTREEFLEALSSFKPDLIVTDYSMPRFDGLTVLKLTLEHAPLTPVIIFTGAINEDTAVECMKRGAADYVIKEHLKRLGQAVLRALEEKQVRLERRQAEEALRESENRYRTVSELTSDFAYAVAIGPKGEFMPEWTTEALRRITGYDPNFNGNVRGDWQSIIFPQDRPVAMQHLRANLAGQTHIGEYRIVDKSGAIHWIRDFGKPVRDPDSGRVTRIIGTGCDRKEAGGGATRLSGRPDTKRIRCHHCRGPGLQAHRLEQSGGGFVRLECGGISREEDRRSGPASLLRGNGRAMASGARVLAR